MKKYFLRLALFFAFFNVWASEKDSRDDLGKDIGAKANEDESKSDSNYHRRGRFAGKFDMNRRFAKMSPTDIANADEKDSRDDLDKDIGAKANEDESKSDSNYHRRGHFAGKFDMNRRFAEMSPTDIANKEVLPGRRFAQNPEFQEMKKAAIAQRKASFSSAEMDEYNKRVDELKAMDEDQQNAVREDLRNQRRERHGRFEHAGDNQEWMKRHAQRKQALLNACLPLLSGEEGDEFKTLMGISWDNLTADQHERKHQLRDKCFPAMSPDKAESLRPKHHHWRGRALNNEPQSSQPSDPEVRD